MVRTLEAENDSKSTMPHIHVHAQQHVHMYIHVYLHVIQCKWPGQAIKVKITMLVHTCTMYNVLC